MKQMMFEFNSAVCISCGACAVACMDQNDIDPDSQMPFRHIQTLERTENGKVTFRNISTSCMHCSDAPCVQACPTGCLYKETDTGLTLYDNSKCIGCHSCVMACPFGAPAFTALGKVAKCNGCAVRLENGLEPACVRVCPFDALKLIPAESASENQWYTVMEEIESMVK